MESLNTRHTIKVQNNISPNYKNNSTKPRSEFSCEVHEIENNTDGSSDKESNLITTFINWFFDRLGWNS